jgi:uncharacterized protein YcbK (DUF882 family)
MPMRTLSAGVAAATLAFFLFSSTSSVASWTSRSCLTSAARNLLQRIESQFGTVRIVSTCRRGATIRGTGKPSRHASGNAIDFNAGSRKGAILRWLIANHRSGGTMTYSGMDHIHVDIGYHFVSIAGGRSYRSKASSTVRLASAVSSARGSTKVRTRTRKLASIDDDYDGTASDTKARVISADDHADDTSTKRVRSRKVASADDSDD